MAMGEVRKKSGSTRSNRRVWLVTELFYPAGCATAHLLTGLASGLAGRFPVSVLCCRPCKREEPVPSHEIREGVRIHRVPSTCLDKNRLLLRLINLLTMSLALFLGTLFRVHHGDRVLVVTNPPLLPFLVQLACHIRGAHCVLLIHDVYPEVLVATGLSNPESPVVRLARWGTRFLYRKVDRIVVLGRDMHELVLDKLGGTPNSVSIIPNWTDGKAIGPDPELGTRLLSDLGLADRFVVQYSGNMGRTHDLETVVDCARLLRDVPGVHFLLAGNGAKRRWLERVVTEENLPNVTVMDPVPRQLLPAWLNACSVALIPFLPGMAGVSVPSRMYNVMAAGRPILAAADPHSELVRVVQEERIGLAVPPSNPELLAHAIRVLASDPAELERMGRRAHRAAEAKYSFSNALRSYIRLLENLPVR